MSEPVWCEVHPSFSTQGQGRDGCFICQEIRSAVAAEKERCAKMVEEGSGIIWGRDLSAAIRKGDDDA